MTTCPASEKSAEQAKTKADSGQKLAAIQLHSHHLDEQLSKQRRIAAKLLTWLFFISTIVAFILWIAFRIVTQEFKISSVEAFYVVLINLPVGANPVSVIIMALITIGLSRHKRIGLHAVAIFQILGLTSSSTMLATVALYPDWSDLAEYRWMFCTSIILGIVSLIFLWWLRPAFPARTRQGSWIQATLVVLGGVAITSLVVTILRFIYPGYAGSLAQQIAACLLHSVGAHPPTTWRLEYLPFAPQLSSLIMGAALLGAILIFLRSSRETDRWRPENELLVRQMLADYGQDDSLGYVATRRDKLVRFDPERKAGITYQVFGSVALASGDPVGDPQYWNAAIQSWDAHTRKFGWTPAVMACSEKAARCYAEQLGFGILRLGDEAILQPAQFRLDTPAFTEVRKAVRRARREGLVCQISTQAELTPEELAEIDEHANSWRVGKVERGFSMALGRFGDPSDPRTVVVVVKDQSGQQLALMTFLPWGRQGLSLDLMRRHPKAPNGVNEFLVAELMSWCTNHGISQVSLNFAFLRHIFAEAEEVSASPIRKINSRLLGVFDKFWQLQRLYRANAKYQPLWSPRYVALPSALSVVSVALASAVAEGFLPSLGLVKHLPDDAKLDDGDLLTALAIESPKAPDTDWEEQANDQQRQRARHARELAELGKPVNPVGSRTGRYLADLGDVLASEGEVVVVGRVRNIRDHGSVCFADLTDRCRQVQIILDAAELPKEEVEHFARLIDSGDMVEVRAVSGQSRNQTPSLVVKSWTILAKAYKPVPWDGLNDPETRLRNRAMDLVVHPDQLQVLQDRSKAIAAVRDTFLASGFTEVETPILQTVHGGATARPFRTYINAYSTDLVARIAPELALKRLVVAGMGSVFEIGRNFRNEGADNSHNPEFTVVEAYQPFADYNDMRLLTQRLIQQAATAVYGKPVLPLPDGSGQKTLTDISGDWPVVPVCEAVSAALGREITIDTDLDVLLDLVHEHDIEVRPDAGPGAIIEELYGELVEGRTIMPTFYVDFPAETSPLTAPHRSKPGLVERWDLVAAGMELGTAYSELTDPLEQRRRFVAQSWLAAHGDTEAMEVDEDFLNALELGMPPTGGLGIGLDRLVMLITDRQMRDVLAFPFVRPNK